MRKDRIAKTLLASSLLVALVALVALSPAANVTPATAAAQANSPARKGQTKFRRVRVNAGDISRLPRGENYVVHVSPDAGKRAGDYTGSTPVNSGVLNSTGKSGTSGLAKAGAGTLPLAGNTVYEFRSDPAIDFSRVVVQAGADAAPVPLETWLRRHRPAAGMRGWPFKRLLIGTAEGVAEIEGWKTKDATPVAEFKCESGSEGDDYCGCSSYADCVLLVISGKCSSELSCGDGECYCDGA
ncbi:MAG TPA: hypothetical protein VEZ40_01445 [Pyrinomonadaceae bacterium]|nr:hypothetical protein [Pyrinomonadaceae bacterium]